MLTVGSLCSGFDGLPWGLELAGWPVQRTWFSEIDPDASTVLARHWPDVPNLGDMTRVDWSRVTPVDVVAGGWPCPAFSVAGKRRGREDARALWHEVARCLEAQQPEWFLG